MPVAAAASQCGRRVSSSAVLQGASPGWAVYPHCPRRSRRDGSFVGELKQDVRVTKIDLARLRYRAPTFEVLAPNFVHDLDCPAGNGTADGPCAITMIMKLEPYK